MRHLLLINPNTNALTTGRLTQALTPALPPGVLMTVRTARLGANYIACEASHTVAGYAVLDAWAAQHARQTAGAAPAPDAILIGCFGDPGLFALRECAACPVTGLAEASFIQAARHGPYAVVTGGQRWKPMLERLALALGHAGQLVHVETATPDGAAMQADPDMALLHLAQACRQAARPGVRSIIIGGAGLAGLAPALQDSVDVPLIDSVQAGLQLLLQGGAPAPQRTADGFHAHWTGMEPHWAPLSPVAP